MKKKLAKYLADYLEREINKLPDDWDGDAKLLIEQGLEAFESTEAVEVLVVSQEISESIKNQIEHSKEITDEDDLHIEVGSKSVGVVNPICSECGQSVAMGSGKFVNRIIDFNTPTERRDMGRPYPQGDFICAECDERAD